VNEILAAADIDARTREAIREASAARMRHYAEVERASAQPVGAAIDEIEEAREELLAKLRKLDDERASLKAAYDDHIRVAAAMDELAARHAAQPEPVPSAQAIADAGGLPVSDDIGGPDPAPEEIATCGNCRKRITRRPSTGNRLWLHDRDGQHYCNEEGLGAYSKAEPADPSPPPGTGTGPQATSPDVLPVPDYSSLRGKAVIVHMDDGARTTGVITGYDDRVGVWLDNNPDPIPNSTIRAVVPVPDMPLQHLTGGDPLSTAHHPPPPPRDSVSTGAMAKVTGALRRLGHRDDDQDGDGDG
jgi:hypothetical protein